MRRLGPFWQKSPSAITTFEDWAWCWISLGANGDIIMIEWL
jgi:hypothetical protein